MRNPETAVITVDRPADFDAFWSRTTADPRPLEAEFRYEPRLSTKKAAVYDVRYTGFSGVRVAGWYSAPRREFLAPPYPALVVIPGYISDPSVPKTWSVRGYAALSVAPRGKLRANDAFNPGYPGLLTHGLTDRDTYGYRGFCTDVVRGLDVLMDRPEVDASRIGVQGSSQGGGLGIVAAALRPEAVRCVTAGAPYLCGILASARLTHSYPYEEINEYLRLHPEQEDRVRETLAYYDVLNFAPKVTAPTMVYLGLEDDVCPPETGFAVHRALAGPKELHAHPRCGHDAGLPGVMVKVEEFLDRHLQPTGRNGGTGVLPEPAADTEVGA